MSETKSETTKSEGLVVSAKYCNELRKKVKNYNRCGNLGKHLEIVKKELEDELASIIDDHNGVYREDAYIIMCTLKHIEKIYEMNTRDAKEIEEHKKFLSCIVNP